MPSFSTDAETQLLNNFCSAQRLPDHYQTLATRYFLPLAKELAEESDTGKTLFIGINGCQGSGKSTVAALLTQVLIDIYKKKVANLSIDDFYYKKAQRKQLAEDVHPLFSTRGVPGTHDIELLKKALHQLFHTSGSIRIPRFNKAVDDRFPESNWDSIDGPVDIIILEGWCVGVTPQPSNELYTPTNTLEIEEDIQAIWRNTINKAIKEEYSPIFKQFNKLIMLKAPSFECVYDWRKKQEDKLQALQSSQGKNADAMSGIMDEKRLQRFIQHYQRLTEHMLATLPQQADVTLYLNAEHQIVKREDNDEH